MTKCAVCKVITKDFHNLNMYLNSPKHLHHRLFRTQIQKMHSTTKWSIPNGILNSRFSAADKAGAHMCIPPTHTLSFKYGFNSAVKPCDCCTQQLACLCNRKRRFCCCRTTHSSDNRLMTDS
jgi:hypothetical protein